MDNYDQRRLQQRQIMRDFLGDIVMDLTGAVTLGGEEGDWEEAAEYCRLATEKVGEMTAFAERCNGEKEMHHDA